MRSESTRALGQPRLTMPTRAWAGSSIAMIGGPYTQRACSATLAHGQQMGGSMGPVNWVAVVLAANLAVALGIVWHGPLFRTGRPLLEGPGGPAKSYGVVVLVMLIGAAMLGHNFARIGAATLQAKPWLYFMQSGG